MYTQSESDSGASTDKVGHKNRMCLFEKLGSPENCLPARGGGGGGGEKVLLNVKWERKFLLNVKCNT